jgi:Ribosomal protein S21
MDASQAFYRCLSRALAHPPQRQNLVPSSRSHLTRPHPRRKLATRSFCSSQRQRQPEDESIQLPTSSESLAPAPAADQRRPMRSFRRKPNDSTTFPSKFESPAPPSFSPTNNDAEDSPSAPKEDAQLSAQAARAPISSMLDLVYGPSGQRKTSSSARTAGAFDPKFYDHMSAYESRPRAQPLTPAKDIDLSQVVLHSFDADALAAEHERNSRLRLGPTLGRTVVVNTNRNVDLNRAFRMLEIKNQANKVRHDEREQKFHVRKGQMRKIMRRRRWRVTFMAGFLEECKRVRRMRKQGW